ncbi:MAG: hypothetical protein AAB851_04045 [Patescibacteria group bacterium]
MEDQEKNEIKNLIAAAEGARKQKDFFVRRLKTALEDENRLKNSLTWREKIFRGYFRGKTKTAALENLGSAAAEISKKTAEINNELLALEIEIEDKIIGCLMEDENFLNIYQFWLKSSEFRMAVSDISGTIKKHSRASFQRLMETMEALEEGRTGYIQEKIKAMTEWENLTIESVKFFLIDFCEYIEQRKAFLQKIYGQPAALSLDSHYKKIGVSCYYLFDNLAANFWRKEAKEKAESSIIAFVKKYIWDFNGNQDEVCAIDDIREKIVHLENLINDETEIIRAEIDEKIEKFKKSL